MTWAKRDGVSTGIRYLRGGLAAGIVTLLRPWGDRRGDRDPVLACALRLVEGRVRLRHERPLRVRLRVRGDAEAGREVEPRAVRREQRPVAKRDACALGIGGGALRVRVREDHGELLAAPAGAEVHLAGALAEHDAELAEDHVPDRVAVAVVDVLEVVEVGEDEGEGAAAAVDAGELRRQRLLRRAAIREAGEPVDERLLLDHAVQPGVVER